MGYRMRTKPASMRVAKTKEIEKKERPKCGECSLLVLNEENRNFRGLPFYGYCPYGRFGYCSARGLHVTYTDVDACEHFAEKGGAK